MKGKVDCQGRTDVGRERSNNEDQFLVAELSKSLQVLQTSLAIDDQTRLFSHSHGVLLLVADGMGGHAAGEVASRIAVDSLISQILNTTHGLSGVEVHSEAELLEGLKQTLQQCQTDILATVDSAPERRGMGTTLTLAYVAWPMMYVAHAGDSRCYLWRNRRLRQITTDHTVAQKLVDEGELDPDEAEGSRWSHMLWNVVGGNEDEVSPEIHKAELRWGDAVLLCTDGLTNHLGNDEIANLLGSDANAETTCGHLIDAANAAGGSDNITVVVARFRENRPVEALADTVASIDELAPPASLASHLTE